MAVVAWPPPTPPNTRANDTLQADAHPLDHNRIADALDTILASIARGRVAYASGTATTAGIGTSDTDTGVSVTFTKVAGRRYRVRGVAHIQGGTAGQVNYVKITDGANAVLTGAVAFATLGAAYGSIYVECEVAPGTAGSATYKLRTATNASTEQLNPLNGAVHWLAVDDIGA